jgi:DNA polymerase-3 subunit delta'
LTAWSFDPPLGQEQALKLLAGDLERGRLAHAYLFEGPEGAGKATLARSLAARMLCRAPGAACGRCHACRMLAGGNHPDVLELPREVTELRIGRFMDRPGVKSESVDHQPLLDFLRFKPMEAERRIAIIPDAERMRSEAANAFLKTLEEPPGSPLILLTVVSRDRLPATIVSRCRLVAVKPLPPEKIAAELARRGLSSGADARDLAMAAEGSLGMAMRLAGGDALELWRWLIGEGFAKPGAPAARMLAERLQAFGSGVDSAGKRDSAVAALDLAALAVRRMLRGTLDARKGAECLAVLWEAADRVRRNVAVDLALSSAAYSLMAAMK